MARSACGFHGCLRGRQLPAARPRDCCRPAMAAVKAGASSGGAEAAAGGKEKRAASLRMRPAACCDSDGIQTRNLLIRSQMLYSVELRSQRFVCASSLNCGAKVVSFLQTAKLFGENFHAKGKKVGFGAHRSPLRGIPWLPSRAGSTGSGSGRLEPADGKSGKQSAWQQDGIRVKSNDQFGFKSIYKSRRRIAMRAGSEAKRPMPRRGSARFGAQQGPFCRPKQPLPTTHWFTGSWQRGPVREAGAKFPYNAGRATGVAGESLNN